MRRSRIAAIVAFVAALSLPSIASAQTLTAPRYHDLRPSGCLRETFLEVSVRDCVYPDETFGMWTDQDSAAALLAYDDGDGNGLTFTDDGLYVFGLN